MTVVDFPKKDGDLSFWVCACGCASFNVMSDGSITCVACDAEHEDFSAHLVAGKNPAPGEPDKIFDDLNFLNNRSLARRRVEKDVCRDDLSAVFMVFDDGSIGAWVSDIPAENKGWIEERSAEAVALAMAHLERFWGTGK